MCDNACVFYMDILQCIQRITDGDYWHSLPGKKEKDNKRDQKLRQKGMLVLRLRENEILRDINAVKQKLFFALT